ncbi:MAG: tetratricopeptide repeat protein [Calditrichaeota bacterium]|nr:MAG: tetratricopeptide repeat protein [Calditrichota bacterium]
MEGRGLKGIGLRGQLKIDGREFNVTTGNDPRKNVVRSEVFESGQYLFCNEDAYDIREDVQESPDPQYVKEVTENQHQQTINEIKILFRVYEKIKQLRQYLPHYRLGKVFYNRNFFPEAIENFQRAIQINPDFVRAYQRLSHAWLMQDKPAEALEPIQQAYNKKPEYPDVVNTLGVVYTHLGQMEKASSCFKKALKLKLDMVEANFNMGVVLFLASMDDDDAQGNVVVPARFMRTFKEMVAHKHYQSSFWQKQFARTREVLADGKKANVVKELLDLQKKILCTDASGDVMDLFFLQFMYGGKNIEGAEISQFTQMIHDEVEAHQNYADYWNELGIIHLIQCRDYFLKALNEFDRSQKVDPHYQNAQKNSQLLKRGKNGFLILLRAILK